MFSEIGNHKSLQEIDSWDNVEVVNYTWIFTDVTQITLSGVNPTYTFSNPGVYAVCESYGQIGLEPEGSGHLGRHPRAELSIISDVEFRLSRRPSGGG